MAQHIYLTKSYCTCLDCDYECEKQADIVKHCKRNKHFGEVTLSKSIDFRLT